MVDNKSSVDDDDSLRMERKKRIISHSPLNYYHRRHRHRHRSLWERGVDNTKIRSRDA